MSLSYTTRYIHLLDTNAHPYLTFRVASRWAGQRLELLVITASLLTNLFVVFSYGIVSPALAGLAVSYTIQVRTITVVNYMDVLSAFFHRKSLFLNPKFSNVSHGNIEYLMHIPCRKIMDV